MTAYIVLLQHSSKMQANPDGPQAYKDFKVRILEVLKSEDPAYHGALEVLHQADNARNPHLAEERVKKVKT